MKTQAAVKEYLWYNNYYTLYIPEDIKIHTIKNSVELKHKIISYSIKVDDKFIKRSLKIEKSQIDFIELSYERDKKINQILE